MSHIFSRTCPDNMEGIEVDVGQTVLLLWSGSTPSEDLQETVSDLQARVQGTGRVQVEHVDRLALGKIQFFYSIFFLPV